MFSCSCTSAYLPLQALEAPVTAAPVAALTDKGDKGATTKDKSEGACLQRQWYHVFLRECGCSSAGSGLDLAALMQIPHDQCRCGHKKAECGTCGLGYKQRLEVLRAVLNAEKKPPSSPGGSNVSKGTVKRKAALVEPDLLSDDSPETDDEEVFEEDWTVPSIGS